MIALDASALLAFMFREPGHERVAEMMDKSCLSTVTLAEVLRRFAQDDHAPERVLTRIEATALEIASFDTTQASLTAGLASAARPLGLALGDCACLALAAARGIPAVTADAVWLRANFGVEVICVR